MVILIFGLNGFNTTLVALVAGIYMNMKNGQEDGMVAEQEANGDQMDILPPSGVHLVEEQLRYSLS